MNNEAHFVYYHSERIKHKEKMRKKRELMLVITCSIALCAGVLTANGISFKPRQSKPIASCPLYYAAEVAKLQTELTEYQRLSKQLAARLKEKEDHLERLTEEKAQDVKTFPAIYRYIKKDNGEKKPKLINKIKLRLKWQSTIDRVAKDNNLDPQLLTALILHESGANPNAVSRSGAVGLTQLMPATAERFGCTNRYDPEQNIKAGAKYLGWLLKRYKGDTQLALMAYNCGEGCVDKWGYKVPYKETQDYVPKVLTQYKKLSDHKRV